MAANGQIVWFEKNRYSPTTSEPRAKINKNGIVILNQAAVGLLGATPDAFYIGAMDKDGSTFFVLQPASRQDPKAMKVAKAGHRCHIHAGRFLKQIGHIDAAGTLESDVEFDAKLGVLKFEL